jgi:RNA 2',3'-cyclic 3'-phosphodiesterase
MPENSSNKLTRAFVCITFPEEVIKELSRIQSSLEKYNFTGKLTELENLHLTLKFLGEISPEVLNKVKDKLSRIEFKPFKAKLLQVGTFNIKGKPKIVWVKIGGEAIFHLQKQIDIALKDLFPIEERFMSHLTIARIKYLKSKAEFNDFIKSIKPKPLTFEVNEFKLNSSVLLPLGPVYTILESYSSKI